MFIHFFGKERESLCLRVKTKYSYINVIKKLEIEDRNIHKFYAYIKKRNVINKKKIIIITILLPIL